MRWSTPLGAAIAQTGTDLDGAVTHADAAEILGVTRGTVAQLTHRGTLARHPDGGGVRLGAVLARKARLDRPAPKPAGSPPPS